MSTPAPTNFGQLNKQYRRFTQAILAAYGRHADTYICMAPSLMNDKDPNQDATAMLTTHLPGDPRVKIVENIPYTDIKGLDDEQMAQHLNNRADKFKKVFVISTRRGMQVEANRKFAEGG